MRNHILGRELGYMIAVPIAGKNQKIQVRIIIYHPHQIPWETALIQQLCSHPPIP
jgi:hypothetical protein